MRAMAPKLSDRYQDVDDLQQAVRDFRDFMRCIEDTHRGDREVDASQQDLKTYVNLNNAIHAYEGALENYPEYGPANAGLAKARFLFAERALNNQDFELGLSTMTDEAIEHQPDKMLASQLRNELVSQRSRRDRRKKLLFVATMASLVSIGIGITTGVFAAVAAREAAMAMAQKVDIQKELRTQLLSLLQTRNDVIELEVKEAISKKQQEQLEKESNVSRLKASIAQSDAEIQRLQSEFKGNELELSEKVANLEKRIAENDSIRAKIDAELFKESTQYNQYKDYLRDIERNLDEDRTKSRIAELFNSKDISLAVKNGWEIHHLYKQTNPATAAIGDQQLGNIVSIKSSVDGNTMVALTSDGQVFRFSSDRPEFTSVESDRLNNSRAMSIDLSPDGAWLVAALEVSSEDKAKSKSALPLVLNLQSGVEFEFDDSIVEQIRFRSRKPDSEELCWEKFYCRPQHVEFMATDESSISLFMVDQRAQMGLNQIRCSVLDLEAVGGALNGSVRKAKMPGQFFLKDPGQLAQTGCLATAVYDSDGNVIAAVAASHPEYAVHVVSIDAANEAIGDANNPSSQDLGDQYFRRIKSRQIRLDDLSPNFAPTAMKIVFGGGDRYQLLIGNGNGEIANLDIEPHSADSVALAMTDFSMLNPDSDSISPKSRVVDTSSVAISVPRKQSNLFASTHSKIQNKDTAPPAHKSIVRQITVAGNKLVSISESEIMVWKNQNNQLVAEKKLFGQNGKISSIVATQNNNQVELYTTSNLAGNLNELRRWIPTSNQHDATVQLEDFKTPDQTTKQIVCGNTDKKLDSNNIVLAFDDGTLQFFSPDLGSVDLDRPAKAGLKPGQNELSRVDFNNGKFRLVEEKRQLLMYSNSAGLLAWNLSDNRQCDPIRMSRSETLFDGLSENSSVSFSSDAAGDNLVSSHPKLRNHFLLWQRTEDGEFAVHEIGPISKSGTGSLAGLNLQIQPVISPDGKEIACVVRLRNTFEVQIFKTSPSRNLQKTGVIPGSSRANFRSIHFIDNDEIVVSQDRVEEGTDRIANLIHITKTDGLWNDEIKELTESIATKFAQISIADVTEINGQLHFAGFGIEGGQRLLSNSNECETSSGQRRMLVWNNDGLLFDRPIPFSRRIAPKFIDGKLRYFVAKTRNHSGKIKTEVPVKDANEDDTIVIKADYMDSPAQVWHQVSSSQFVVCGTDWFTLMNPSENQMTKFVFLKNNPAKTVELADQQILVHHQDNSVSFVDAKTKKVRRGEGFFEKSTISASGKLVALAGRDDEKISIQPFIGNNGNSVEFESAAKGMTWIQGASLARNKFANRNWPEDVLVTASIVDQRVRLEFRDANGNTLQLPDSYTSLPLRTDRTGQQVKSFSISAGSARLISIIWASNDEDRCDIWQYANIDKPDDQNPDQEIPSQWFVVDSSKLGKVDAIGFSEVVTDPNNLDSIASRIVIGADNQGSKSIGLYALELGMDFRTKPLLDLFVTDKLQKVDKIIGANFSSDGKTMLAMTSDRAQIRLTDGWQVAKVDADYDDRIRVFNSQQNDQANQNLPALLKETSEQLDQLSEPEELAEENSRKMDFSERLKLAEVDLAKHTAELKTEREKIESERRAEAMQEIQQIKDEINQLERELDDAN